MKYSDLTLIQRHVPVFEKDYHSFLPEIKDVVSGARILVIGGAGSIGSTVVRILFDLAPKALHVLDVNENALADLVRSLRSSSGYTTEDFLTICYDPLHPDADQFIEAYGPYDIILNFAAVKHVRSEKDPFTLARMLAVNIHLTHRLTRWAKVSGAHTLFSVSTDKAANPANLMGASKRLMEMVGFLHAKDSFSTARFANVAFSNGSLLKAFYDRLEQGQPFSAPSNIKRFFITHQEAARLCLLEALTGPKHTVAIPRAPGEVELTSFVEVAENVLSSRGFKPLLCETEEEARSTTPPKGYWPCYFFESDTSGEKPFEEFIAENESLGESPFAEISLIHRLVEPPANALEAVLKLNPIYSTKEEIVNTIADVVPGFAHVEKGRNLDQRM
ncbi:MAG: polysaccharide biosynthesis protein [Spirochaetales bacterium]|nr:polysaccharide biosynthesis protein [Spirochaetales bacterium]